MENAVDPVAIILLLGATQGLFLTLLLFTKPVNKTPNRLLAWLIISYSAFLVETSVSGTPVAEKFPHILGLMAGVVFLNGPLHYLYTLALIKPDFSLSKRHLPHFIPFVLFYLCFLFPYYLQSGDFKIAYIRDIEQNGPPLSLVLFSWAVLLQGLIYMIVTLRVLDRYSRAIKDTFSTIDKINLNWLKTITVLTMIVWILGIIIEFLQIFDLNTPFQATTPIAIAILIYVMGYLGLRQPEIFAGAGAGDAPIQLVEEPESPDAKKYERSGLTKAKAEAFHKKLLQLMETEKPFTYSSLKLNQLAKMIGTTPNYLSQVINEERDQNFYDFVNGYRIEEAKRMIQDPANEQVTLLSIAYDVGFNSKSAFNTAFKKYTGTTPSQFRKNSA
jgi:AraC-like DNA-binding protein